MAQEIRRLVQLAYPTATPDILDVLGKDQFIDALEDSDIRWRVYQIKARTLDDAVCAAVEMEAYKKAETQRIQSRKSVRQLSNNESDRPTNEKAELQHLRAEISHLNEKMSQLLDGEFQKGDKKFPDRKFQNKKLECWNCGKEGHFRKDCREPARQVQKHKLSN